MSKRNGSTRHYRKLRQATLEANGWQCAYCGQPATEADHITPVALGGQDTADNLTAVCRRCNAKKSKKPLSVFLGAGDTPPYFPVFLSPTARISPRSPFMPPEQA